MRQSEKRVIFLTVVIVTIISISSVIFTTLNRNIACYPPSQEIKFMIMNKTFAINNTYFTANPPIGGTINPLREIYIIINYTVDYENIRLICEHEMCHYEIFEKESWVSKADASQDEDFCYGTQSFTDHPECRTLMEVFKKNKICRWFK